MAFFLRLWANPIARQIMIYLAIALLAGFALWRWGTIQWQKGEAAGEKTATGIIEKKKQAEWTAREDQLKIERQQTLEDKRTLEKERSNFEIEKQMHQEARRQDEKLRQSAIQTIQSMREADRVKAISLPASDLVPAIRTLSEQLAREQSPIK
jgi:hypothetical protein